MSRGSAPAAVPVRREDARGLALVTLAAPERGNALDATLRPALLQTLAEATADPGVRALVLAGDGADFCTGLDLAERAGDLSDGTAARVQGEQLAPLVSLLVGADVPVVAALQGSIAGAGLGLALACDLRVAAVGARLETATGLGQSPDAGLSWLLPRLVGDARARALLLLGEPVSAEQALEMGLVNAVVAADQLLSAAVGLATRLAAGPSLAYAAIKAALLHAGDHGLASSLAEEDRLGAVVSASADHAEGVRAALAGDAPTFHGR